MIEWNEVIRRDSFLPGIEVVSVGYRRTKFAVLIPKRFSPAATTLWQREFFDHILRSDESYSQKWNYVRDNPVRAGLASTADEWKYAGEIETLML